MSSVPVSKKFLQSFTSIKVEDLGIVSAKTEIKDIVVQFWLSFVQFLWEKLEYACS